MGRIVGRRGVFGRFFGVGLLVEGVLMAQVELRLGDGVRGRRGVGGDAGSAMGCGRVMGVISMAQEELWLGDGVRGRRGVG